MRFRFTAVTKDGDTRSGFLEADDEAAARRQIERRGMSLQSLAEDLSEVPSAAAPEVGAVTNPMGTIGELADTLTRRMPAVDLPKLRSYLRNIDWKSLDWKRVGLAAAILALILALVGKGLSLALADPTYRLRVTGQFHVVTRSRTKVKPEFWKRVHPRLWLPKQRWFIDQKGNIYAKASDGKWKPIARKARVRYNANIEGNYTIDIEVALPARPEGAGVVFLARGFKRVSKKTIFRPKKDVLECQVPTVTLKPIRGGKGVKGKAKSPTGKPKTRPRKVRKNPTGQPTKRRRHRRRRPGTPRATPKP